MAKYMIHAAYTAEGLKGLLKDKASGRRDAIGRLMESVGGKLDAVYYTLGEDDVIIIIDAPDLETVTAIAVTVSAAGLVRTRTTALLTVEETDRALQKTINYRPPGR